MTIQQRKWQDAFNQCLDSKVADMIGNHEVDCNAYVDNTYRNHIIEDMYSTGATPEDAADYAAKSLIRKPLLDRIQSLSVELRETTDEQKRERINTQIKDAQRRYNEVSGRKSFALHESADIPNMICWGRGYGESGAGSNAVNEFNTRMMMRDPYTGQTNIIMARLNQFAENNASKYSVDTEPELDKYVDTLFLGDMGPEAFTVNGDKNPYRLLEQIRAGEDVVPAHHGVAVMPSQMPVTQEKAPEDEYLATFDEIFSIGH